jgi:flagellar L-ring protein FlgH
MSRPNRTRSVLASGLVGAAFISATASCAAADDALSMFDDQTYRSLVAESKAFRAGDVLTVVVQETASATSTADVRGQRNFATTAEVQLIGLPRTGATATYSAAGSTGTTSDGTGTTQRSGRLLAQLSVRVLEVAPNGDLVVAGKQSLRINGEEQMITLSGVVRKQDISENNTVLSSRIAEARIQFDGEGFVTDQSKPGLLAKLFNFLGL